MLYLTISRKGLQLKTIVLLVFFIWLVKYLENLQIIRFQYGFGSFESTANLLTVVSNRIDRDFNRSGTTPTVAFDILKAFDKVCHAGHLHKLKSYGISGQIFGLISSFLTHRQPWMVLDGKSSQEYPVNAGIPQGSVLGPTFFLLYINALHDDFICNIAIYTDLWQQLELAPELKSNLWDTADWGQELAC